MPSQASFTYRDFSGEISTVTSYLPDTTAANFDAQQTAIDALAVAIAGVTNGQYAKKIHTAVNEIQSQANASAADAQRERKILVRYQDNTTMKLYRIELPCADVSALTIPSGTDLITVQDGGVMAAFAAAFEADFKSETGGAVSIIDARLVGRST